MNGQPRWCSAFAVMLLLATGQAIFGLSEDSAATIIGHVTLVMSALTLFLANLVGISFSAGATMLLRRPLRT